MGEEILLTTCLIAHSQTLETITTILHSLITDLTPSSLMMNMIMAIQIEGLELLGINQEMLQKNLQKPFMSQKKIYKGQLSFQVKIKKILTQDFLKMNQDKLQNSIQLHSKAIQLTKMAIKLPSTKIVSICSVTMIKYINQRHKYNASEACVLH